MDPLSTIASTIALVQAASSTYKAIHHLRGLPKEFDEVSRNLPLAEDTLSLARDHLQGQALDESSRKALEPFVSGCEEKAKQLQNIFERVEKGVKNSKDTFVLELYRTSLLRFGKAHRVEILMQGILKSLDALATNQLFRMASQGQITKLNKAMDQLSKVKSSVPDSDFESLETNFTQHNASGATGYQTVNSGSGQIINSGSGKLFNAHTMNFGSGKSVLAKYLVDSELKTTNDRTTCYFFFKDDFEDQRNATSALSCILHQLFLHRNDLFSDKMVDRFESYRADRASSFDELWGILVMASQQPNAGEIACILDGFDECEDQERRRLSQALNDFYSTENETKDMANLKFLVTSRPYDKIRQEFQDIPVICLRGESEVEISKIAQEIDSYIQKRVSRIGRNLYLSPNEEQLIMQKLREVPNQTCLWVSLTLELIESDISINKSKIRTAMATSSLPQTIDDAYERLLAKSSNPMEANKLLHIIVAATRPLTLAEMNLAPEGRFRMYVRDLCGLFVNIIDSNLYLFHQTAKEFLVPKHNFDPSGDHCNQFGWKNSLKPPESHRILCKICVWHLLFTEFDTPPLDDNLDRKVSDYLDDHVFLEYSATNWAAHFRASDIEDNSIIDSLRQICDASSSRCLTWFRAYWTRIYTDFPQNFTTLMIASYFGIEQIVKPLLENGDVEVDSTDSIYRRTALSWASENGFDGVVKLLVKRPISLKAILKLSFPANAKIDTRDIYGRTPLSYAAWNGHIATVQRLVRAGARADLKDEIGGTPISYAFCTGHDSVASQLIKETQTDSVDEIRRELLFSAVKKGFEPIIKRLLDSCADINAKDKHGQTSLWYATHQRNGAIIKLLLKNGANIETRDRRYSSFAIMAAFKQAGQYLTRIPPATYSVAASRVPLAYDLHSPRESGLHGNTTPIIFMHGFLGSKRENRKVSNANLILSWRLLSNDLSKQVFTVDLRNHGDSAHHPKHDYMEMALDVASFMESHGLERAILIGHSMGAKTALTLALHAPDLVSEVIAIDNCPVHLPLTEEFPRYLRAMAKVRDAKVKTHREAETILKSHEEVVPFLFLKKQNIMY
ncbi:Ankyrin repeat, PH and SEC7 domain containing protein secG [Talaromyces islandicus]|uniref:Ankyrin repeat, PH and SEC7 domain containing protein secG n=1 Tax=Talaromyces islandicus TaxID=28573 RepID=A0A0U1M374_TALIS|nr:Ankyrin repeat, PH and SEC7 domain containing protein secG [Talaromyces islandicus]